MFLILGALKIGLVFVGIILSILHLLQTILFLLVVRNNLRFREVLGNISISQTNLINEIPSFSKSMLIFSGTLVIEVFYFALTLNLKAKMFFGAWLLQVILLGISAVGAYIGEIENYRDLLGRILNSCTVNNE